MDNKYVKLTATSPIVIAGGSPHVTLTCENHPDLFWSCKNLAVSPDANGDIRYNGIRNIFFKGKKIPGAAYLNEFAKECDCHSSKLVGIEEDPEQEAALEAKYDYLRSKS